MISTRPSDSPPITLEQRIEKYAGHLADTSRLGQNQTTIDYLKAHGLGYHDAVKYRLGVVNPADESDRKYEGRLSIPFITRAGVKWVKYRCVQDHDCATVPDHGKYIAPFGEDPIIFNPEAFFAADDTIGVAEGEIDAIVATEKLGIPTIGIPGVEIWQQNRKQWRHTLTDYDNVLIFVDGDKPSQAHPDGAGLEFARAVQKDIGGKARLVRCPLGEDVASLVASGRSDYLLEKAGIA